MLKGNNKTIDTKITVETDDAISVAESIDN